MLWPSGGTKNYTLTRHNRYGTFGLAWLPAQLPLGLDGLLQLLYLQPDLVQDALKSRHITYFTVGYNSSWTIVSGFGLCLRLTAVVIYEYIH